MLPDEVFDLPREIVVRCHDLHVSRGDQLGNATPERLRFEDLQLAWQAAIQRAVLDAIEEPTSLYPENLALWRASHALATVLDLLEERPPPYVVLHEGMTPPPSDQSPLPGRPGARPQGSDLSRRLEHLVDTALTTVGDVVHAARNRLVATVGRPLLITGATLGMLLLILRATVPSPQCEGDSNATPGAETG